MLTYDVLNVLMCAVCVCLSSTMRQSLHWFRGNRFVPKLSPELHCRPQLCVLHLCAQRVWYESSFHF